MGKRKAVVKEAMAERKTKNAGKTPQQVAASHASAKKRKEVVEQRVEAIVTAILEGARTQTIVANAVKQYGVSDSTAYKYYHAALTRIRLNFDEKLPDYIKTHLERLEHIYKVALQRGELKPALAAMQQISRLLGLDAPVEVKNTHGFEGLDDATDDQLKRIITAGVAIAGGGRNAASGKARG